MASQRSLGPILEEARAEREAQLRHQEALDTKAGILLGFAGALVVLSPPGTSVLLHAGRAAGVAAAIVALSVFWPRSFPTFDLRELRDLYLAADPAFTLQRILDSQISMIDSARAGLERKASRLKLAMSSLAAGSVLTASGLVVRW